MTHDNNHNANTPEQLDALLRQWHEQNAASARANRDTLMARLARQDKGVVARIGDDESPSAARRPLRFPSAGWLPVAASLAIMVSLVAFMMGRPGGYNAGVAFDQSRGIESRSLDGMSSTAVIRQASFVPEGGRLDAIDPEGNIVGSCPLQHTDVVADIQGRFARVSVKQRYANPFPDKIEAVYTFPLSHTGAVDRMAMTIGDRVIVGEVKERTVARNIYEQARTQGRTAALLEQERPNIFTQYVANIEPGAEITVEISYVEMISSNEGEYAFFFPMTVAPRYIPGYATADAAPAAGREIADARAPDEPALAKAAGEEAEFAAVERPDHSPGAPFAHNTEQVPDASRITPTPTRPEVRAGHDISIEVNLQTGGPGIVQLDAVQHEIEKTDFIRPNDFTAPVGALIHLKEKNTIPNKDFVLKWRLTDESIENQVFSDNSEQGGFLTLSVLPPARVDDAQAVPRELVFVLDTSGSMNGFPIEKAKEVMTRAISQMRAMDSFNIITFAGSTRILWDAPKPATPDNIAEANAFVNGQSGAGGTEMMSAINAALAQTLRTPKRGWITPREFTDLYKHGDTVTLRHRMLGSEYLAIEGRPSFEVPIADGGILVTQISQWTLNLGIVDPQGVVTLELKGKYELRNGVETFLVEHAGLVPNDFITAGQLLNLPADGRRVEVLLNSFDAAHDPLFLGETAEQAVPLSKWVADLRMRARIIEHEFRKSTIVGRWVTQNAQRVLVMDQWGGTEVEPVRPVRICMFLTDGQVGNDHAIIDAVQKNAGTTRVFSFGVGSSPNRYLLDGIALAGRGAADYVTLQDTANPIVARFVERIRTPVLSDVSIEFNAPAPILDVVAANVMGELTNEPGRNDIFLLPDLYDRRPITLHARFNHNRPEALTGTAVIRGRTAAGPFERTVTLDFPPTPPVGARRQRSVLPTLWAREKVNQLLSTDLSGLQLGAPRGDVHAQVVTLGETFSIMTPFTSFVAVDRARVTIAGEPRLVHVPVELPEGQSYEGIFGQACRHLVAANPVVVPTPDQLGADTEGQFADRFAQMRELQMQQKYREALQVAEEILYIDPSNKTALLMKPVYEDILFYHEWETIQSDRAKSYIRNGLETEDALGSSQTQDEIRDTIQRMLDDADSMSLSAFGAASHIRGSDGAPRLSLGGHDSMGYGLAFDEEFVNEDGDSDFFGSIMELRAHEDTPGVFSRMAAARPSAATGRARAVAPTFDDVPELDLNAVLSPAERVSLITLGQEMEYLQFYDLAGDGMSDDAAVVFAEGASTEPGKVSAGLEVQSRTLSHAEPSAPPAADANLGLPAPATADDPERSKAIGGRTDAAPETATADRAATAEDDRADQLRRRLALYYHLSRVLHPALQQALAASLAPANPEAPPADPHPIAVTVLLTDTSDATIAAVRKAGFRTDAVHRDLSLAVGVVPPARLLDLALTPGVRRVEPTRAADNL